MDIHKIEQRIKAQWDLIDKHCPKDKKILKKFEAEMYANGLSNNRVLFYLITIYVIAKKTNKPIQDLDIDDIKNVLADIEKSKYSEWTKSKYRIAIKKFYQWAEGYEWNSKEYPDKIKWVSTTTRKSKLKRPVILTKEEVLQLFRTAKGLRNKAMVSFMYETGCRCPDELLHMKISDIEFDEHGAKVKLTSGKVGDRKIRIVSCVPHLKKWIENHPNPKNDSYVWVSTGSRNHAELLSYSMFKQIISNIINKAGIEKRITPYSFRRTRYTHLATTMPTPLLYKFMGQVQGSKVIERYVELNEEAVDNAILGFHGIKPKENGDIKALFCSRCGKQNSPELDYCNVCHGALTDKALQELEDKKELEKDVLYKQLVQRFKEELKAGVIK